MKTVAKILGTKEFPLYLYDKDSNRVYYETSDGDWFRQEYDKDGNEVYCENSNGHWSKYEYDKDGNRVYFEDSDGYWYKSEYDKDGNKVYYEASIGTIRDNRPNKTEVTMNEVAEKFGIPVKDLRIKKK